MVHKASKRLFHGLLPVTGQLWHHIDARWSSETNDPRYANFSWAELEFGPTQIHKCTPADSDVERN